MRAIKKRSLFLLAAGALTWQACDPPGPTALLRGERLIHEGRYAGAIEELREATSLLPENAQAWNHLGLAHHWAREYNPAVQAYRQALKLNYDLAPARFNLGSLLLEINQAQLAAVEFAAYTQLEPDRPGGWVRRGLAEWQSRNWDAAHDSFQTALRLDPVQPMVWNSIGVIELYRRNHMAAFNAFQEALRHRSDYPPAIYNAALVAHFYLPREPQDPRPFALQKYREYLALDPQPLFTDVIGRLSRQLDKQLNPAPVVARVLEPKPSSKTNQAVAVQLPPAPKPPSASPATNSAPVKAEPPKPAKPIVKAMPEPVATTPRKPVEVTPPSPIKVAKTAPPPAQIEVVSPPAPMPTPVAAPSAPSSRTTARETLKTLMDPPPQTPVPVSPKTPPTGLDSLVPEYQGLSYAYYNPPAPSAGFRHKAKPYFDEGRRLQRLNRMDEAIAAYQRAIHWDGAYFEAYHNLGLAAATVNDFLRAAVAYETALALQPQSAATRYNFALLLSGKGYHRDAAVELERLLQQDGDDARAHLLLATLYDKRLGITGKARDHYEAVLRLKPGHPQGTAIRYWLKSR